MKANPLWIKIFECDGGQVAYMLDQDDEGNPTIVQKTMVDDVSISVGMGFKDTDEGYDVRDKVFAGIDQEKASQFMTASKRLLSEGALA